MSAERGVMSRCDEEDDDDEEDEEDEDEEEDEEDEDEEEDDEDEDEDEEDEDEDEDEEDEDEDEEDEDDDDDDDSVGRKRRRASMDGRSEEMLIVDNRGVVCGLCVSSREYGNCVPIQFRKESVASLHPASRAIGGIHASVYDGRGEVTVKRGVR